MSTGKTNRNRGFNFEREIVNQAKERGLEAVRAWGSNGKSIGEAETVDCKIGKNRIQAKRVKALSQRYKIPEGADVVIFREDHGKAFALIPYEKLLDYYSMEAMVAEL